MAGPYSYGPYHLCRRPSCHCKLIQPALSLWLCVPQFPMVYLYRHYIVYHIISLFSRLTRLTSLLNGSNIRIFYGSLLFSYIKPYDIFEKSQGILNGAVMLSMLDLFLKTNPKKINEPTSPVHNLTCFVLRRTSRLPARVGHAVRLKVPRKTKSLPCTHLALLESTPTHYAGSARLVAAAAPGRYQTLVRSFQKCSVYKEPGHSRTIRLPPKAELHRRIFISRSAHAEPSSSERPCLSAKSKI